MSYTCAVKNVTGSAKTNNVQTQIEIHFIVLTYNYVHTVFFLRCYQIYACHSLCASIIKYMHVY